MRLPALTLENALPPLTLGLDGSVGRPRTPEEYPNIPDFQFQPGEAESALSKIARTTTGSVAAAGNILDLPDSMFRDVAAGLTTGDWDTYNPFDQILSPRTAENRATGRDLNRLWGLAGPEDTWGNWWGGLATEVGLSPMSWVTLGGGALTKAGSAARKAGLLDDVFSAYRRTQGLGKREARLTTSPQDLLDFAKEYRPAAESTSNREFLAAAEDALMKTPGVDPTQRIGGRFGAAVPFTNIHLGAWGNVNRARKADQRARRLMDASPFGNEYQPFRHLAATFMPTKAGFRTAELQEAAPELVSKAESYAKDQSTAILEYLDDIEKAHLAAGISPEDASKLQRDILEGVKPWRALTGPERQFYKEYDNARKAMQAKLISKGIRTTGELQDVIEYATRQLDSRISGGKPGKAGPVFAQDSTDTARRMLYKGFHGGTRQLNDLAADPKFDEIAKIAQDNLKSGDPQQFKKALEDAADLGETYIRDEYIPQSGRYIEPYYISQDASDNLIFHSPDKASDTTSVTFRQLEDVTEVRRADGTTISMEEGLLSPREGDTWHWQDEALQPKLENRYRELTKDLVTSKEKRGWLGEVDDAGNPVKSPHGIFTNHWAVDSMSKFARDAERAASADFAFDMLGRHLRNMGDIGSVAPKVDEAHPQTVGKILSKIGIDPNVGAENILSRHFPEVADLAMQGDEGADAFKSAVNALRDTAIQDEAFVNDITKLYDVFQAPETINTYTKMLDSYTALFKVGVLTWPARYFRDIVSGTARNIETGLLDNPKFQRDAHKVIMGDVVRGYTDVPAVKRWLNARNMEITDENATKALRHLYARYGPGMYRAETDVAGGARGLETLHETSDPAVAQLRDTLMGIRGREPRTVPQNLTEGAKTFFKNFFQPWKVRGFGDRTSNLWGPAAVGDMVGRYTDDSVRLAPFLNGLKRGESPDHLMRTIREAQVNYDPRNYTNADRVMRRVFPFWTFQKAQFPFVVKSLFHRPGGRLSQLIQGAGAAGDPSTITPDYVAETLSVPANEWLGQPEGGGERYFTGLGFMFEDPLSFFPGSGQPGRGISPFLQEVISRTNFPIKVPIELASGKSMFQKGPMGGRELSEMDPLVGRLLANIAGQEEAVPTNRGPLGRAMENIIASSPVSRALTTARVLTDDRKTWPIALMNTLTGFRTHDVSPAVSEQLLRQEIEQRAVDNLGAKQFQRTYIPRDLVNVMPPDMQQEALAVNALLAELADRAKERAAARDAAEAALFAQ